MILGPPHHHLKDVNSLSTTIDASAAGSPSDCPMQFPPSRLDQPGLKNVGERSLRAVAESPEQGELHLSYASTAPRVGQ